MSNTLIYAMSSVGSLKLERFNELFRHVYLPVGGDSDEQIDVDARQQTVRILDSLGYCEFDFDSRTVYMCKPALILLPSFGLPKALLVGARTPRLVNKIKRAVHEQRKKVILENISHSGENAAIPSAICLHAISKKLIKDIADEASISCDLTSPAAWKLVSMSAGLDSILEELRYDERAEPGWNKRTFDNQRLMFSGYLAEDDRVRLSQYRHPVDKQLHHWFWDNGKAAVISRDWGRYAILAKAGRNILIYNEWQFKLAVPVTVPLPCLLARAASLCSGSPPYQEVLSSAMKVEGVPSNHPLQVYSGVPPKIAGLIALKLNQKLLYTSFSED